MKYNFNAITVEELSFKLNRVKFAPDQRLDIKPQFSRQLRKINGNDKINCIVLSVKIESTEAEPKPFDIHVTLVGVFEAEDIKNQDEERRFVIEATKTVYPYLRSAVSSLTASANIPPLYLPVIAGPIFPEDRDVYAFTTSAKPDDNLN